MELGATGVPVAERVFGEGALAPAQLHPAVPLPQRPHRGRHHRQLADVGDPSGPVPERHGPRTCRSAATGRTTTAAIRSRAATSSSTGCTFDTGDDCIALKSGRNEDGRRVNVPIENVIVRNCTMKDGHGGVVIGSEISGGARNIFAERCRMDSPRLDRALRIKTNSVRGGTVEGVYMRDVTVGEVAEAVLTIDYLLRGRGRRQVPAAGA